MKEEQTKTEPNTPGHEAKAYDIPTVRVVLVREKTTAACTRL
jgi:hypothetical protein